MTSPGPSGESTYLNLRERALNLEPSEVGIHSSEALPHVFGGVMDMAFPNGAATLVALSDGSTSLYTSGGGGVIGGGAHPTVVRETMAFLATYRPGEKSI